jgi:hypothetical protein
VARARRGAEAVHPQGIEPSDLEIRERDRQLGNAAERRVEPRGRLPHAAVASVRAITPAIAPDGANGPDLTVRSASGCLTAGSTRPRSCWS